MSLVGSHIEVRAVTSGSVNSPYSDAKTPPPRGSENDDVEDLHPPISPKSGCEEFFLGEEIDTQSVSATALAEQLRITHQSRSTGGDDFVTARDHDDFMTAASDPLHLSSTFSHHHEPSLNTYNASTPVFGKDALAYTRSFDDSPPSPEFHESNMSTTPSSSSKRTNYEINPAEKVYITAKDVWGWGKTVMVFKPFLGLAEGVAGKAVSIVGSSLADLDGAVTANLTKVDDKILNPSISAVVNIVFNAMQKTEDIVKPVIMAVLKPIGLVKGKAENPELTTSYKSAVVGSH
jgi:hypothetical protein